MTQKTDQKQIEQILNTLRFCSLMLGSDFLKGFNPETGLDLDQAQYSEDIMKLSKEASEAIDALILRIYGAI